MIEILAFKNNEMLLIERGKEIKIELASNVVGNHFNVYWR
jgi:hypothetical protein